MSTTLQQKQLNFKMGKRINRYYFKENIQMANKYMK